MEHADDSCNDCEALLRNSEPFIECGNELRSNILARVMEHVLVWPQDYLLLLMRPSSLIGLGLSIFYDCRRRIWAWWTRWTGQGMKPFARAWRYPVSFWYRSQHGFGGSLGGHAETCGTCTRRYSIWRWEVFGNHHRWFAVLLQRYEAHSPPFGFNEWSVNRYE